MDEKRKREGDKQSPHDWAGIFLVPFWHLSVFVIINILLVSLLQLMWTSAVLEILPNAVAGGIIPRNLDLGQAAKLVFYMNVVFLSLWLMGYTLWHALSVLRREPTNSKDAAVEEAVVEDTE